MSNNTEHTLQSKSILSKYLSLVKFSHTIFALPFALVGFTMAVAHYHFEFKWSLLIYVVLCMVFARSAAMGFNRYLDRNIDARNPRTQMREIPAGQIRPRSALWFVILNSLLFVTMTYFINPVCFYLSPVALFVILFYSYTKRFTALCHLVLGAGLGLAPIGAFLAVSGHFYWAPVLLSFAVFTWTAGFDIIYALQDDEFDKSMQLHSIPSRLGRKNALMVSNLLHLFTFLFIVAAGWTGGFHLLYWLGTAVFTLFLIYQHRIVNPDDLSRVNLAFGTTNGIASVLFAIFAIVDFLIDL